MGRCSDRSNARIIAQKSRKTNTYSSGVKQKDSEHETPRQNGKLSEMLSKKILFEAL
jgi:hypothetical protein